MGWSDFFNFTKKIVTSDIAKDIAAAAAATATTYIIADSLAGGSDTPSAPTAATADKSESMERDPGTVADARQKAQDDARGRRGRQDTILTGPQGLSDDDDIELMHRALLGG